MFFGDWTFDKLNLLYSNTSYLPDEQGWSLQAASATYNGQSYTSFNESSAFFSSSYKHIGVDEEILTAINNLLEQNGFVCITDPYGDFQVCEAT